MRRNLRHCTSSCSSLFFIKQPESEESVISSYDNDFESRIRTSNIKKKHVTFVFSPQSDLWSMEFRLENVGIAFSCSMISFFSEKYYERISFPRHNLILFLFFFCFVCCCCAGSGCISVALYSHFAVWFTIKRRKKTHFSLLFHILPGKIFSNIEHMPFDSCHMNGYLFWISCAKKHFLY